MKTKLVRERVCVNCLSVEITDPNCVCTYDKNFEDVELEFEVCACCNKVLSDGAPADTEFNKEQLSNL